MARYAIWDKKSDIYTPVGEKLTAEQWMHRYGWAAIPGVKMVIGGGAINGTVAMEFDSMVEMYVAQGMEIPEGTTDEEILALIEAWETRPIETEASAEERIAAALEYQNLLNM